MTNYNLTRNLPQGYTSDLTPSEFKIIVDTIIDNDYQTYLEIGVWHGVNLFKINEIMDNNKNTCMLMGADCFDNAPEGPNSHVSGWPKRSTAEAILKDTRVFLVTAFSTDTEKIKKETGVNKFDCVFQDANHEFNGVFNDLVAIDSILSPNGTVLLHNSDRDIPEYNYGARSAILKFCQEYNYKIEKTVDSITVIKHV